MDLIAIFDGNRYRYVHSRLDMANFNLVIKASVSVSRYLLRSTYRISSYITYGSYSYLKIYDVKEVYRRVVDNSRVVLLVRLI